MTTTTTELAFENEITAFLVSEGGYIETSAQQFSRDLALDQQIVLRFVQTTQPKAWEKLSNIHGSAAVGKFTQRLHKELELRGMLDVLRHGITDYGVYFDLAYFKPATKLNPDTLARYAQNILTVTRQVRYSLKDNKRVDLMLSVNGLPVATVELKNQFTGQSAENAKTQYMNDRDPRELLFQFKKRALVHFAVDTNVAWMTTRLAGKQTRFLPFNKGYDNGAGNPPNLNGHSTAYLWEEVWARDSWLEILGRFVHLKVEEVVVDNRLRKKEVMIFPRFHQLDVVRRLSADVEQQGSGKNYLIQHSTGSGKSFSIAWLAYQLSRLHDIGNQRIFNTIIVVTDRRVLDAQLQNTIYQLEHKFGTVQKIDRDSTQLAEALQKGVHIPHENDQGFWTKTITDSGFCRSPILVYRDHD